MNLDNRGLLDFAKDHQANIRATIFESAESEPVNKVQKYSLKRRVLVVFMATGIYFTYILFQFLTM
jgi:hypothetical protein